MHSSRMIHLGMAHAAISNHGADMTKPADLNGYFCNSHQELVPTPCIMKLLYAHRRCVDLGERIIYACNSFAKQIRSRKLTELPQITSPLQSSDRSKLFSPL